MLCPICLQSHKTLVHHFNGALDEPIVEQLQMESPEWQPNLGACTRCIDQAQIEFWSTQDALSPYTTVDGYKILPLPQRLGAHPDYSGKGITICFIDSGFYPHSDIKKRILSIEDLSSSKTSDASIPSNNSWHGTMTSVVGTGDGTASNGVYRGLAASSKLVLLKVADETGKISGENIAKAIQWAIDNRKKFAIRILNLSVTDDWSTSYRINAVDQAIQKATEAGIVVIVAAGNDEHALVKAPANSPHAITIGGLDDHNTLHPVNQSWYPSTFGTTVDGFQKPDLIAPAIWIPAPILPMTQNHEQAGMLFALIKTKNSRYLKAKYSNTANQLGFDPLLVLGKDEDIRKKLEDEIGQRKLITSDYQHADGTSFAAPIVSGIVAQMLEADPTLTPQNIKEVLSKTARSLPNLSTERQGAGVVHALNAVKAVTKIAQPRSPIVFF